MNQFKSILLRLHGENKDTLRKLYLDKQVLNSHIRSSERPVEDEKIYVYDDLLFRFAGTGIRNPQKMNLFVYIPLHSVGLKECENHIPYEDFLLREISPAVNALTMEWANSHKDNREKAQFECQTTNHCVLRRSGLVFDTQKKVFILRILFVMPLMNGVFVNAKQGYKAVRTVLDTIEKCVNGLDKESLRQHARLYQHQMEIREWLKKNKGVAFVANGSILPRQGDTNQPMKNAIPFLSPEEMQKTIILSDGTRKVGMMIPAGITVITGGGYSGKSTLLNALETGIYNHIRGDGREYVLSLMSSTKIYAEDGRAVSSVDLSMFFKELPGIASFDHFSTAHASGSISQATNILEAVYSGCRCLLIDEDTSATNFMIRDEMMRQLVKKEPIIPFTDRVRQIYEQSGVSTILVIGGSSEYLQHADKCLLMDEYKVKDVTDFAQGLSKGRRITGLEDEKISFMNNRYQRNLQISGAVHFSQFVSVNRFRFIQIDNYHVDMTRLTSLVSEDQLKTVAYLLTRYLGNKEEGIKECRKMAMDMTKYLFDPEIIEGIQSENYQFTLWFEEIRPMDLLAGLFRMRK